MARRHTGSSNRGHSTPSACGPRHTCALAGAIIGLGTRLVQLLEDRGEVLDVPGAVVHYLLRVPRARRARDVEDQHGDRVDSEVVHLPQRCAT